MAEQPKRASIVSGYFNPFHQGHLDLFEQARERSGYLIVVVNNDAQQRLQKGRIIQSEDVRARIVAALRCVDDTFVALESGPGIDETFDAIRARYPETELEFCNGGDRPLAAPLTEAAYGHEHFGGLVRRPERPTCQGVPGRSAGAPPPGRTGRGCH